VLQPFFTPPPPDELPVSPTLSCGVPLPPRGSSVGRFPPRGDLWSPLPFLANKQPSLLFFSVSCGEGSSPFSSSTMRPHFTGRPRPQRCFPARANGPCAVLSFSVPRRPRFPSLQRVFRRTRGRSWPLSIQLAFLRLFCCDRVKFFFTAVFFPNGPPAGACLLWGFFTPDLRPPAASCCFPARCCLFFLI